MIGKSTDAVAQVLLITIVVVRVEPHRNRHQRSKEPAHEHWTSDDRVLQLKFPGALIVGVGIINTVALAKANPNGSLSDPNSRLLVDTLFDVSLI